MVFHFFFCVTLKTEARGPGSLTGLKLSLVSCVHISSTQEVVAQTSWLPVMVGCQGTQLQNRPRCSPYCSSWIVSQEYFMVFYLQVGQPGSLSEVFLFSRPQLSYRLCGETFLSPSSCGTSRGHLQHSSFYNHIDKWSDHCSSLALGCYLFLV